MASRILVLSDLHAFMGIDGDKAPSLMSMHKPGGKGQDLLMRCAETVQKRFGTIDGIFVAGDLTDRAEPIALTSVWQALQDMANLLSAPLIATAGNHDYDSRGQLSPNARGSLIDLSPHFPFDEEDAKLRYFTYDFAFRLDQAFNVIVINSAAQHGYGDGEGAELKHGRVTSSARARISTDVRSRDPDVDSFALMHHQPMQLPGYEHEEVSTMIDGQELLNALGPDWFVVHGHKHRPYLQWAAGGADSALLMSASSFSANTGGGTFGALSPNQFHVIETASDDEKAVANLAMAGTIYTWTFDSFDWRPAGSNGYFPAETGYGWRGSTTLLSRKVVAAVTTSGGTLDEASILSLLPELRFLPYQELKGLEEKVSVLDEYVIFQYKESGRVAEISRNLPVVAKETEGDHGQPV